MNTIILIAMTKGAWAISCFLLIICFVAYIASEKAGWIKDGKWVGDVSNNAETTSSDQLDVFITAKLKEFVAKFGSLNFNKEEVAKELSFRVMGEILHRVVQEEKSEEPWPESHKVSMWLLDMFKEISRSSFDGDTAAKRIAMTMDGLTNTVTLFFFCSSMFCFMVNASHSQERLMKVFEVYRNQVSMLVNTEKRNDVNDR